MPKHIDKIDQNILFELDRDCRTSLSLIATKIQKTPQYVKYRIDRLKNEQIIKQVAFYKDFPLKSFQAHAYITTQGMAISQEKLLVDSLLKLPEVVSMFHIDGGEADIVALLSVNAPSRFFEIKELLYSQYPQIKEIKFYALLQSHIFTKKYLSAEKNTDCIVVDRKEGNNDELGNSIYCALEKNPFASLMEIASLTNEHYPKIKYRMKKQVPFKGSRLILSEAITNKAVVFIASKNNPKSIISQANAHPNVVGADIVLGKYSLILYFESHKDDNLDRAIKEFLYQFHDSIIFYSKSDIITFYRYKQGSLG